MIQLEQIKHLSQKLGLSHREAKKLLAVFSDMIHQALEDSGEFRINKVGRLYRVTRPERKNYNPVTEREDILPERIGIKFKQSKAIK